MQEELCLFNTFQVTRGLDSDFASAKKLLKGPTQSKPVCGAKKVQKKGTPFFCASPLVSDLPTSRSPAPLLGKGERLFWKPAGSEMGGKEEKT